MRSMYSREMSDPSQAQIDALRLSIDTLVRVFRVTDSPALGPGMPKVGPSDMQALIFLQRNPGCISADLSAFLGVVPTTTSALVDRLVRLGLVNRARTESNRRVVLLGLTDAGEDVTNRIIAEQNEHCRIMLSALSDGEREPFLRAALKISSALA